MRACQGRSPTVLWQIIAGVGVGVVVAAGLFWARRALRPRLPEPEHRPAAGAEEIAAGPYRLEISTQTGRVPYRARGAYATIGEAVASYARLSQRVEVAALLMTGASVVDASGRVVAVIGPEGTSVRHAAGDE